MFRTENGEERKDQAEVMESFMWDHQPHWFGIFDPPQAPNLSPEKNGENYRLSLNWVILPARAPAISQLLVI